MPASVYHVLSATTPDDPAYEIRPSHWNSAHSVSLALSGSDISAAFNNAGGVTFGLETNGSITASAPTGAGITNINVSAGTTSYNLSKLTFADSNGVVFGINNSTVTASHNGLTTQSAQAFSADASSTFQTLTFQNSNGVSFSNNAGALRVTHDLQYTSATSAITSNALNTSASRVINIAAATNNTGGGTASVSGNVSFSNANGATFYTSAGPAVALSYTVPAVTNSSWSVSDNATSLTISRLAFTQSNNVTMSLSTGAGAATVIASASFNQSNQSAIKALGASNTGNTAGNTGVSTGVDWVIAGSNNVTISQSTVGGGPNTLWVSGPTVGGAQTGISGIVVSNTTYTSGTVSFSNANGISFGSVNATAISASYTVPTVTNSSMTVSDNATSGTLARLAFTNLNGVTLSLSSGAGGSHTIVGSHNALTSQSNQAFSADASSTFQTLSFQNSNGVSFSNNAGALRVTHDLQYTSATSAITSNALNTSVSRVINIVAATNNAGGGTASQSGNVSFSAANGMTFYTSAGGAVVGSYTVPTITNSSWTVSDNATSLTISRLAFTQSNGLTLSLSTGAGAATVIGSYTVPTQTNQSAIKGLGASNTGNTAGNTGLSTGIDWVIAGSQAVTISQSTVGGGPNTLWVNAPNAGAGNVTFSAGAASAGLASIVFSNSNGVSFGLNGSTITATVSAGGGGIGGGVSNLGNTAGSTGTVTTGNIVFVGSGPISLSQSTGAAGSAATISINAPATSSIVGASGAVVSTNGSTISVGQGVLSYFGNMNGEWGNSTTMQMSGNTSHIQPFLLEQPVSWGYIRIPMSLSNAPSSTAATTGNTQFSYGHTRSHNFVIYSRGVGGNSLSLQSVTSTQLTDRQSMNVSAAANSTQFSYTNRASYQMSTGEVGYTYDYSSSAASLNFHTSGMTGATGLKQMEFKWQASLPPGQYWLMYGVSSSTASQYTNQGTRWFNIMSYYGVSQPNLQFGTIGDATHSSVGLLLGNGSFTTAGGSTTASLPISAVTTSAAHNKMVFQLINIA